MVVNLYQADANLALGIDLISTQEADLPSGSTRN